MDKQSIDASVFSVLHPYIAKRFNISRVISYFILFVVGLLIIFSAFEVYANLPVISFIVGCFGVGISVFSILRVNSKSQEIVYLPTGCVATKQTLFFDFKYFDQLKEFVCTGTPTFIQEMPSDTGGNVRLDILESADRKFIAMQLYRFIPYEYTPATPVYYYTEQYANNICNFISEKA